MLPASQRVAGATVHPATTTNAGPIKAPAERANVRNPPETDCGIYASGKKGTKCKTTGRRAKAGKFTWVEIFTPTLGHAWVASTLVKAA